LSKNCKNSGISPKPKPLFLDREDYKKRIIDFTINNLIQLKKKTENDYPAKSLFYLGEIHEVF